MKLDNTLLKIIDIIRLEVKEKYKLELSTQEIVEVIQTQIEATKLGLSKGISVTWYRFCKFIFSERATRKAEVIKQLKQIDTDYEGSSLEDLDKLKQQVIIESAEKKREYLAKGKEQDVGLKIEDVQKVQTVNKVNVVLFKQLNAKHSK